MSSSSSHKWAKPHRLQGKENPSPFLHVMSQVSTKKRVIYASLVINMLPSAFNSASSTLKNVGMPMSVSLQGDCEAFDMSVWSQGRLLWVFHKSTQEAAVLPYKGLQKFWLAPSAMGKASPGKVGVTCNRCTRTYLCFRGQDTIGHFQRGALPHTWAFWNNKSSCTWHSCFPLKHILSDNKSCRFSWLTFR